MPKMSDGGLILLSNIGLSDQTVLLTLSLSNYARDLILGHVLIKFKIIIAIGEFELFFYDT